MLDIRTPHFDQAYLKSILHYAPDTGVFKWRVARGNRSAGSFAGCVNPTHCTISIDRLDYVAHRLAWMYMYGVWPIGFMANRT